MNSVLPGVDVLYQEQSPELLHFLRQRRCGLVTNHTGRTRDGKSTLEVLEELEVSVGALFFPEHGPRGVLEGNLESTTEFGRTHHSLYGETRRPTSQMLQGIDALVFDIQDVGARFYTYSSTLALCLEACAEHGVAVVVLDRPNPLGGEVIEGPLVDEDVRSFVGHVRLPVRHGMTLGEMARLHVADEGLEVDLRIAPVEGWTRSMLWPETGLEWIAPSPNLPDFASAQWYPGPCLLEFSGVSVGRGTQAPFAIVGAPWLNSLQLLEAAMAWPAEAGENFDLEAIEFAPTRATHEGEPCYGVRLRSKAPADSDYKTVALGIALLATLHRIHPAELDENGVRKALQLLGSRAVLDCILQGDIAEAIRLAAHDAEQFAVRRAPFLLY